MSVKIIGTGSYVPQNVVDNSFLSTIVDTDDEWISSRTGIKERRLSAGNDEGTTAMATNAAMAAVEDAGIDPEEIDLILVATASADMYVPNTSCQVQEKLGAKHARFLFQRPHLSYPAALFHPYISPLHWSQ